MTKVEDYARTHTRKEVYAGYRAFLRMCKLCGNYYPLSQDYFPTSPYKELPGIVNKGLLLVCKECGESWGPDLHADINSLIREGKEAKQSGKARSRIIPIARRGVE